MCFLPLEKPNTNYWPPCRILSFRLQGSLSFQSPVTEILHLTPILTSHIVPKPNFSLENIFHPSIWYSINSIISDNQHYLFVSEQAINSLLPFLYMPPDTLNYFRSVQISICYLLHCIFTKWCYSLFSLQLASPISFIYTLPEGSDLIN